MAINIKEIFKSDLDPNGNAWWSNDKIDKINHNFNQLSNGGMQGPQGYAGIDGSFGSNGVFGPQGYAGIQGMQGSQGAFAQDNWDYYQDTQNSLGYLFPKKIISSNPFEYSSIVMRVGIDLTSPLYTDSADYDEYSMLSNIKFNNDPLSPKINLRLQSDGKVSDWRLLYNTSDSVSEIHIGKFVTSDSGFELIHVAENIKLGTPGGLFNSTQDIHDIKHSLIKINANATGGQGSQLTTFDSGIHFRSNDTFIYNRNAVEGYVLKSVDSQGTSVWADKKTIFGSFPIGTIISIRESDFNTSHFYLDEDITQDSGNPVLKNRWGRGKSNTDYAGWYLCNGETWQLNTNINSYLTPNLNSFNYTIQSNTGDQELVTNGDNTPIIIGGYDISMTSVYNGNGQYTSQFTNIWEDNDTSPTPNDTIDFGSSNDFYNYASRMVHIVYLEREDLTWVNADGSAPPPPPPTSLIPLTFRTTNPQIVDGSYKICNILNPNDNQYSWTGGVISNWENAGTLPGVYLYDAGTTTPAASGFYMRSTPSQRVWRQWNSITATFSVPNLCGPLSAGIDLAYATDIVNLNGDISDVPGTAEGLGTYLIDSGSFDTATEIIDSNNQILAAGWYRDISIGGTACRRYWDGVQFWGEIIYEDYVLIFNGGIGPDGDLTRLSTFSANANGACNPLFSANDNNYVYVVTSNPNIAARTLLQTSLLEVNQQSSPLFVHLGWLTTIGSLFGTPPLVLVSSQNRPGGTTALPKYLRIHRGGGSGSLNIVDQNGNPITGNGQHAAINQINSTVGIPVTCP